MPFEYHQPRRWPAPETLHITRITEKEDRCLQEVWWCLRQAQVDTLISLLVGMVIGFGMFIVPQLGIFDNSFSNWYRAHYPALWSAGLALAGWAWVRYVTLRSRYLHRCRRLYHISRSEIFLGTLLKLDDMQRAAQWANSYGQLLDPLNQPAFFQRRAVRQLTPPRSMIHAARPITP